MRFEEEAIIVAKYKLQERFIRLVFWTKSRGICTGLANFSKKNAAAYEIGAHVYIRYQSRLDHQLGRVSVELLTPFYLYWMHPKSSWALLSMAWLLEKTCPENQPYGSLYDATFSLIKEQDQWQQCYGYADFEYVYLKEMGFALDISECAVSEVTENLSHISPKTGRAVSKEVAKPYASKLIELPSCFEAGQVDLSGIGNKEGNIHDVLLKSLSLTGFFIQKNILSVGNISLHMFRKNVYNIIN